MCKISSISSQSLGKMISMSFRLRPMHLCLLLCLIGLFFSLPSYHFSYSHALNKRFHSKSLSQGNVTAIFELNLNQTEIVRGQDDLVFTYRFVFENGSFIPSAVFYYNVSGPSHNLVFEDQFNITSSFKSVIVPWYTFNSQPEGNYTLFAFANSTSTGIYSASAVFVLKVLQTGLIRMIFSSNPVYLERNQTNSVHFEMTNVGATVVTNITWTLVVEVTGTTGFLYILTPPVTSIQLSSGETFSSNISIIPDTYLYKRIKFSLSYFTIDDPSTPKFSLSDTLEVIVYPNISISAPLVPENITIGNQLRLVFNVSNNENDVIYIAVHAESPLFTFHDFNDLGSIPVSPQWHQFAVEGTPLEVGHSAIFFWVDIEWRVGEQILQYSTILDSIIYEITVLPKVSPHRPIYSSQNSFAIIFTALILAIGYFSRDFVSNIFSYVRKPQTHIIPETNYPLHTVVLDGSNIAWEEKNIDGKPKISNIEAMINKLSQANFTKIITVADAALRYQIDDVKRLDLLVKEGAIKMLPARVDGDKFILRLAEEENAMIVSNDLFKEYRDIAPWIEERRIPYTILDGEVYLHPTYAHSIKDYEGLRKIEERHELKKERKDEENRETKD